MTFGSADGGIVSELQSRHGHSAQPESQQVLAVLQAVLEVIAAQEMQATPTTIFAALMSALERPDAQESHVTALAMCTVLSTALTRVPNGVLRSKFVGSVQLLSAIVEQHKEQAPACKAALQCLGQVLSAVEPGSWHAASVGFQLLLSFNTDARPKIRKRATSSVIDMLAAAQTCPGNLAAASEAVLTLCKRVLPGPAAAQRAAAAASNKQRPAAEAAIVSAVADLLHILGALKSWAPLMAGSVLPNLIDMLVKLYSLHQPLVNRHTSEVLAAVTGSSSSHLGTGQLAQLLGMLIDGEAGQLLAGPSSSSSSAAGGGDQVAAMARLLEGGLLRLADSESPADAAAAARLLPRVVHLMVPLLSAEQDGVRYGASGALQSLLNNCATPAVLAAMQQQQQQRGGLSPLQSLVSAVAAALGARYQEAWGIALPVAGKLFEVLAAGGAAEAAAPMLTALGQICAGLSDAAEQREAATLQAMEVEGVEAAAAAAAAGSSSYAAAAEAALGLALKHLGPEVVLRVLPLDLQQGLSGSGEARTWLLPALRRHVSGTQLRYWAAHLMPLAKEMGQAAGAASQRGHKELAAACHALEVQLWGCLQAFANWPTDGAEVYPDIVRELASAFHVREDLRNIISSGLLKLSKQARSVALAALNPDTAPHLNLSQLSLHSRQGLAAATEAASAETLDAIKALGLVSAAAAAVPRGEGLAEEDEGAAGQDGDGSDDEFEEYGASEGGSSRQQQQRQQRRLQRQQHGGEDEGPDGASHAPQGFTAAVALRQLEALRGFSSQWMTLLCRVYIDVEPEARGPVGDALAAYASISDKQLLSNLYRLTLQKYQKVTTDASSDVPVEHPLLEGGSTSEERQASFLELALCLAAGLPDAALDPLFVVCQQHVLGGSSLLQKRSYRVLAYLAGSRPDWLKQHLQQMLELMLLSSAVALSPAKRYRLRCLRPIILLLDSTPCPVLSGLVDASTGAEKVPGGAALAAADDGSDDEEAGSSRAEERRLLLAQTLVGELVLATKEVNKKTRASAYQLIVDIAHELDDARPLSVSGAGPDSDDDMDYGAAGQGAELSGGLIDFVNAVMAGLVGASPHMQSAAVLALSRLVFEFAGQLEGVVGRLLPAVLLLLRSHSREVIKAVLGFIKVCAMRMPVDMLLQWLPQMMEGMLIWSDDSKNKFRLKIRVIIERLVRRCGVEPVAAACPADDVKLMTHIRKQQARKERRRAGSEAGSQADEAEFDRRSRRSSAARTARASEWGHTAIFSDEGGGEGDTRTLAGRSSRGGRSVAGASSMGGRRRQQQHGSRLQLAGDSADPQDLLEPSTARQMVKLAAGASGAAARGQRDADPEFPRGDDGRFVIKDDDDDGKSKKKRKRRGDDDGFGSDNDSDMEDMRGFAGLDAAVRSVANAKSVRFAPSIAASLGNRSLGQRSTGSKHGGKPGSSSGSGKQHSGDRYKPKAAGATGDVKGKASVDPYAYWQFDRKMLNRRRGKQAAAAKGLGGVVAGAQAGALKGAKAKRAAAASRVKRAKR